MSYIDNDDLQCLLGAVSYVQLTDDAGTGAADERKADEARLGAEGEADSYLATRYAVPVAIQEAPAAAAALKSFVLDLAAYRLHSRRPPVPADIVRRRDEAVTWLSRVASGVVHLPAARSVRENGALGVIGEAVGPRRSMTREALQDL